ncbi:MAG: HlyD family efflux transporter periplasmic adaptor subunit [Planctomycetota bacterium]
MRRKLFHALGLLLGVGIGAVFMIILVTTRPKPVRKPVPDLRPLVEVMTVSPRTFEAVVSGFGTVRPSETLPIVVEVGGQVLEMGKDVAEGALVEKDSLLFRVDDTSLRAEIERLEAQVASFDAQMAEMQAQNEADSRFLGIEESLLKLAEKEYTRLLDLVQDGQISQSELDAAQMPVIERQLVVEKRRAALSSFQERLSVIKTTKRAIEASLKSQNILLTKTSVRAPYRCRILELSFQLHQVVQPGSVVMSVFPLGAPTEISVPVESRHLPALFDFERSERGTPPWTQFRLEAEVTWDHFGRSYKITGHVTRFGAQVDPNTRTLTAIIELPSPQDRAQKDGPRGLLPGTFVQVRIRGRQFENVLVLPEKALESRNAVNVVLDGKLHRVEIEPLLILEGDVVLPANGALAAGSKVITTEVPGAFEGTPVHLIEEGGPRK